MFADSERKQEWGLPSISGVFPSPSAISVSRPPPEADRDRRERPGSPRASPARSLPAGRAQRRRRRQRAWHVRQRLLGDRERDDGYRQCRRPRRDDGVARVIIAPVFARSQSPPKNPARARARSETQPAAPRRHDRGRPGAKRQHGSDLARQRRARRQRQRRRSAHRCQKSGKTCSSRGASQSPARNQHHAGQRRPYPTAGFTISAAADP